MTWLQRINGGLPMQAGDYAVIAVHGSVWVTLVAYATYRIIKHWRNL